MVSDVRVNLREAHVGTFRQWSRHDRVVSDGENDSMRGVGRERKRERDGERGREREGEGGRDGGRER